MSILRSYNFSKNFSQPLGEMGEYQTRRNLTAIQGLCMNFDHIRIKFYTLDFYGSSYYHRPWDYWRKNFIEYTIHDRCHFPLYFFTRAGIFGKIIS